MRRQLVGLVVVVLMMMVLGGGEGGGGADGKPSRRGGMKSGAAGISFNPNLQQFVLSGKSSSYVFRITSEGLLEQLHWGGRVGEGDDVRYLSWDSQGTSFDPEGDKNSKMLEWADSGTGDFRTPSLVVRYPNGSSISPLIYDSHVVLAGKPVVDATQPATYVEAAEEATTLRVLLRDPLTMLRVELWYTVFHAYDIITRRAVVRNTGEERVEVEHVMSATIDLPVGGGGEGGEGWTVTHLAGAWARERHVVQQQLRVGTLQVQSRRGASSHQHNPFMQLSKGGGAGGEWAGEHYGVHVVHSGNFLLEAEMVQTGRVRVQAGINPFGFRWVLEAHEAFVTPEAVLAYSAGGAGELSRQLHRLYRTRLARGQWRDAARPILVNSWEAFYFDVSEEKILKGLAEPAAGLDLQLVVLDDGWFGNRSNDRSSLGDWEVNLSKFPRGLGYLAQQINALGLGFGIWMEPEMVSVDSNLYRTHPDWCLHVGERRRTESRHQLVLDLTRAEVRDYLVSAVSRVLSSANIIYLKWDFNRHLTEVYSEHVAPHRQGEVAHRFVLGVYDVMERITGAFPHVLFEGCSGGGGRFDPGMLYYMPQMWASDNTDAVGRARIQWGSSLAYPASAVGAHVSKSPNEQNGRPTPFLTRALMALSGSFGFELDLSALSSQDQLLVRRSVALFHRVHQTVRLGDLFRLSSPHSSPLTAWMYLAPDHSQALVFAFLSSFYELVWDYPRLCLRGLPDSPDLSYHVTPYDLDLPPLTLSAHTLIHAGLPVVFQKDAAAILYILDRV